MIHKALEAERPKIHALTIKTKTPESWASESELAVESAASK
jgi:acid stress-induced BolA-like protein IbaG/YrbA